MVYDVLSLLLTNLRYRWVEWRSRRPIDTMPADYQVRE